MADTTKLKHKLREDEAERLLELRIRRASERKRPLPASIVDLTTGQKVADKLAATMGSWPFIIIQTTVFVAWIILNVTAYVQRWDPTRSFCSTWRCRFRRHMRRHGTVKANE